MTSRKIRRRCSELVAALDIPEPFEVRHLADNIAAARGRPIILAPGVVLDGGPGMWLRTPDEDFILYESETSGLHQEHIQLHELGHMLCGHQPTAVVAPEDCLLLFPHLDPNLVNRTLRRTHYGPAEEREAELVASLILAKARRWRPARERITESEAAGVSRRVAMSLESPDDRS